jgi:hypothetical protein
MVLAGKIVRKNEPILKPPGKGDNGSLVLKKCYLVRLCPLVVVQKKESGTYASTRGKKITLNKEDKMFRLIPKDLILCLHAIQVLNEYNRTYPPVSHSRRRRRRSQTPASIRCYSSDLISTVTEEDFGGMGQSNIDNDIARILSSSFTLSRNRFCLSRRSRPRPLFHVPYSGHCERRICPVQ